MNPSSKNKIVLLFLIIRKWPETQRMRPHKWGFALQEEKKTVRWYSLSDIIISSHGSSGAENSSTLLNSCYLRCLPWCACLLQSLPAETQGGCTLGNEMRGEAVDWYWAELQLSLKYYWRRSASQEEGQGPLKSLFFIWWHWTCEFCSWWISSPLSIFTWFALSRGWMNGDLSRSKKRKKKKKEKKGRKEKGLFPGRHHPPSVSDRPHYGEGRRRGGGERKCCFVNDGSGGWQKANFTENNSSGRQFCIQLRKFGYPSKRDLTDKDRANTQ